jgi:glutathione S-transferase
MRTTLYALPGSHPCAAVEAALQLKGVDYRRVDMVPLQHLLAGPLLYGGITVPGIRHDGERLLGSRRIMRRLDELAPQPPLLPEDLDERAKVLELERWGEEVLQVIPRQTIYAAFIRDPPTMESYAANARLRLLQLPSFVLRPLLTVTARLMALRNRVSDRVVEASLAALPAHLERIDASIAIGLLGGPTPNAADLQIGSSIRLLNTIEDLRPLLADHPATTLMRYFPPQPGSVPAGTLPASWLPER